MTPLETILDRLERVKRSGSGWVARCPAHEDREPSLSVAEGEDGRALLNCHVGCATEGIAAALGLELRDLFPEPPAENGARRIVATYDYVDEEGELLFQVCRYNPKGFAQRRRDGAGGWTWKLGGTRRVLYRLPRVREAIEAGEPVYLVEGEKDVEAVEAAGAVATTSPQGAGKWRAEYAEQLQGAHVVLVADNDATGYAHALEVAASLDGAAATVELRRAFEGKDAADHLTAGLGLDALEPLGLDDLHALAREQADTPEPDGEGPSSWTPRNLALLGERPPVLPTLGGISLLYPGKRHVFSGPQESAKTIAAYAAVLGIVRDGGSAIVIDLEMGEYDARDRLRDIGATGDELARIHYVEPETAPTEENMRALVALAPQLVLIDAAAGAFDLSGLDDNARRDVERFLASWVRPFWRAEIASLTLDHVTKDRETRGKYAIGSERKVGGIDVHLGFEVVTELSRGRRGLYKIRTHKDRLGHLPRPTAAELAIVSDPATHALTWTFKPVADTHGASGTPFRPTVLMERVSRYLETQLDRVPLNHVEAHVDGKGPYIREAVEHLVRDGYIDEERGPRKARLLASLKPFREHDLVPTSSRQPADDLVPPRPATSSPQTRMNKDEAATSSHLVPTSSRDPGSTSSLGALSPTGGDAETGRGDDDLGTASLDDLHERHERGEL